MNLEVNLRAALRREAPPADFADRVLARVKAKKRRPLRPWMAIAAALAAAAIIPAAYEHHESAKKERAREAARELTVALKIAGQKLHWTQQKIRRRADGV
jgi:hypothetical protein